MQQVVAATGQEDLACFEDVCAVCDREHLLLSARQGARAHRPPLTEDWKPLHRRLDVGGRRRAITSRPRGQLKVLQHGLARKDLAAFGHLDKAVADSLAAQKKLLFLPTRLTDGIELSDDPLVAVRSAAYGVSFSRRSR